MIRRAPLLGIAAALLAAPAAVAQTSPVTVAVPPPTVASGTSTSAVPPPASPAPVAACPRPAQAAPSQALLGALGVLRRQAKPGDALPAVVVRLLRARGLGPVDPASARLLRTTPEGGKAWIVPVPCVPATSAGEGVAVAATGAAPAGGGASLSDLVRGRGDVSIDVCAGPGHDMLGVSGVVPDGVAAAYLTAPDGTAVRADVADNGYAFVVPSPRDGGQRYVVWTGGDGTPHVQPVPRVFARTGKTACRPPAPGLIRVTPEPRVCRASAVLVPTVPHRRRVRPVPPASRVPHVRPARPAPQAPKPPRTRRARPVPVVTPTPAVLCAVLPLPVPVPAERPPVPSQP